MKRMMAQFAMVLLCLGVWLPSCFAASVTSALEEAALKRACLEATIKAIDLEITRYQRWIDYRVQQGNTRDLLELRVVVEKLQKERDRFTAMDAADYDLPEQLTTTAWVQNKAGDDTLLYLPNMTKMGPFYHAAGIAGGNYGVLQPNVKYQVILFKVYPRAYWSMDSDYVFIAAVEK